MDNAINNYDLCIACPHLGKRCNGPNLAVMTTSQWCAWIKKLKDHRQLTDGAAWSNEAVADLAGVSRATVARIMSESVTGLTLESTYRISYALIFRRAPGEQTPYNPCAMAALGLSSGQGRESILQENKALRQQLAEAAVREAALAEEWSARFDAQCAGDRRKIDYLREENRFKSDQLLTKDEHLRERAVFIRRKDRVIVTLSILLGIAVLIVFLGFLVDMFNPSLGFFWRS